MEKYLSKLKQYEEGKIQGKDISSLPTPACIVYLEKIKKNCDTMLEKSIQHNIPLRPMTKTHKTIEGALYSIFGSKALKNITPKEAEEKAVITVSTMGEAEFYALNGFRNILYPYPPSIDKIKRAHALKQKIDNFYLSVDNIEVLTNLLDYCEKNNVKFDLYIDIDPNEHRSGANMADDSGLLLAKTIIESKFVKLHGIYVHGGHSYGSKNSDEIKKVAEQERDTMLNFAQKIKEKLGYTVSILAIGSTPTLSCNADSLKGITELHPGNYTLYDAFQSTIGACSWECCAATVLTRVLSKYSHPHNRLLIDAGAFALSKDRGPTHINNYNQYGVIVGHPELRLAAVSQEVGIVVAADGKSFNLDDFPVGTMLEIIPNHSCMTCYCYEELNIVDSNNKVIDTWKTCPRH